MNLGSPDTGASRPALYEPTSSSRWTHGELQQVVSSLAVRIRDARGRLAFLLCRSTPGAVVGYLACLEAGCAVALLDARTPPGPLRDLLDRYRPELCMTVDDTSPGPGYRPEGAGDIVRPWWREGGGETVPSHPDLAVLLSTSGSTGSPKLVRLTRRNLEANADAIVASLGIDADERAMASLPLHYSYGLSVLNSHLRAGASVVLTEESVVSPRFWKLFRAAKCTSMPGVPYTYELLARLGFEGMEVPVAAHAHPGRRPARAELVRRFHAEMARRGGRFYRHVRPDGGHCPDRLPPLGPASGEAGRRASPSPAAGSPWTPALGPEAPDTGGDRLPRAPT